MKISRRTFLMAATSATVTVGLGLLSSQTSKAGHDVEDNARYTILYDSSVCVGCNVCQYACQTRWNLDRTHNKKLTPTTLVHVAKVKDSFVRHSCMHCGNAMCTQVCPVGAATRSKETGLVYIDQDRCIGCKYCLLACPWHVPKFDEERGVATKCTGCYSYVARGMPPACVRFCPYGALHYGKRSDMITLAQSIIRKKPDLWIYGVYERAGLGALYLFPNGFHPVKDGVFPDVGSGWPATVNLSIPTLGVSAMAGLGLVTYFSHWRSRRLNEKTIIQESG